MLWHFVILGCQDDPVVSEHARWRGIKFGLPSANSPWFPMLNGYRYCINQWQKSTAKKLYHPTEEHKSCAEKPWKNPIEGRCLHWCLRAMLHFSYHSNYSCLLSVRLFVCYSLTTCLYNNSLNSCFVLVFLPESGKYLQHCCWRTLWPAPAYALLAESTYTWQAKHLKRESTTAPRWTKSWPFFRFQLQLLSEDGVCLCWCCPPCFCCSASICLLMCEARKI